MSTVRLTVRDIPADLHTRMRSLATQYRRTINGQILELLEDAVERETGYRSGAKPARKGRK